MTTPTPSGAWPRPPSALARGDVAVRRGLRAGGLLGIAVGSLAGVWVQAPSAGMAVAVGIVLGLAVCWLTATTWVLLASALDLLAGVRLTRRRSGWIVVLLAGTLACPLLVLALPAAL